MPGVLFLFGLVFRLDLVLWVTIVSVMVAKPFS
jgi:hypothetical protein